MTKHDTVAAPNVKNGRALFNILSNDREPGLYAHQFSMFPIGFIVRTNKPI